MYTIIQYTCKTNKNAQTIKRLPLGFEFRIHDFCPHFGMEVKVNDLKLYNICHIDTVYIEYL